jgi:predicted dehydrogenase
MDLGVHLVDLALWVLDGATVPTIEAVHGGVWSGGEPIHTLGIDDFASARIDLAGGAAVSLAASWNAHAGQDCVLRLAAFGTAGGAEFRNVGGSFFDFELVRFHGRSGEVVVRESRDWLGKAILDWAGRLGDGGRYDPEIGRSITVSRVVDALYGRD